MTASVLKVRSIAVTRLFSGKDEVQVQANHADDLKNGACSRARLMPPEGGFFLQVVSLHSSRVDETAALAAVFFQQLDVGNRHAAVHRFAHVVDGEQGDLDSR